MKIRKSILLLAAATLVLVAGVAWAQPGARLGQRFGPGGNGRFAEFIADYLDLTDAQKVQAKQIFASSKAANQPLVEQGKQIADQAQAAVKAGKPDAELHQIANAGGAVAAQAMGNHLKAMSQFYALLTPAQKEKADRLRGMMRSRLEDRIKEWRGQ